MNALVQLTKREIIRFLRQRGRLIGALLTPLLFWAMIGGGLGRSFQDPSGVGSGSYLEFFFPGALALSVLFTAIFSTISVIEDRHEGFMQGILVSPTPRSVFLLSKILGAAILGSLQGILLLIMAPFAGVALSFSAVAYALIVLFVMAACMTTLGFYFAWKIDSVQGYHNIMNTVLMPMWILSGAVFPVVSSHKIFQILAVLNPLTYGMKVLRACFYPSSSPMFLTGLWPLALFGIIVFTISLKNID